MHLVSDCHYKRSALSTLHIKRSRNGSGVGGQNLRDSFHKQTCLQRMQRKPSLKQMEVKYQLTTVSKLKARSNIDFCSACSHFCSISANGHLIKCIIKCSIAQTTRKQELLWELCTRMYSIKHFLSHNLQHNLDIRIYSKYRI